MPVLSSGPGSLIGRVAALLDGPDSPKPRPEWLRVMEAIVDGLKGSRLAVEPFTMAWEGLFTLTTLLDHLQDGDELSPLWFAQLPQPQQYQLIFGAYAIRQRAVTGPYRHVPAHRVARLQQLWSSCVEYIAEGQYRDLTETVAATVEAGQSTLDVYEAIIELKAGTLFELGFGGVAMLCTDDEAQVDAARGAGKLFGMLLQYGDDLLDSSDQQRQQSTITLQRALEGFHLEGGHESSTQLMWAFIYTTYVRSLTSVIAPLPEAVQQAIQGLVSETFGVPPAPIAEAVKGRGESSHEP